MASRSREKSWEGILKNQLWSWKKKPVQRRTRPVTTLAYVTPPMFSDTNYVAFALHHHGANVEMLDWNVGKFYSGWLPNVSNPSVPFCFNARVRCRATTSWPLQPCQPTQTFHFSIFSQKPMHVNLLHTFSQKIAFSHFFWFSAGDSCWYLLQTRVDHGTLLRARCSDDLRGERLWYTHPHSWVLCRSAITDPKHPPRTFPCRPLVLRSVRAPCEEDWQTDLRPYRSRRPCSARLESNRRRKRSGRS